MTITLPAGLADLDVIVGASFPEANEDALWRCAKAWESAAAEIRGTGRVGVDGAARVLGALGGESRAAFESLWQEIGGPDGFLHQLAGACDELAAACDAAAAEVEYAKMQYIGALIFLAASVAFALATIEFGGVSALTVPSAVAATQFTVRLILTRLVTAIALSVAFNVSLDGLIQLTQILNDHRADWDLDKTVRSIEDGALYGAVTGGALLGAGRFAPGLVSTRPRQLGVVAVAGGVGGIAAPLAHGEVPDGKDILLAMSSSFAGAAPDLVRHPQPGLGRLHALEPDQLPVRELGESLGLDADLHGLRLDAPLRTERLADPPVLSGDVAAPHGVRPDPQVIWDPASPPGRASPAGPWTGPDQARVAEDRAVLAGPVLAHPDRPDPGAPGLRASAPPPTHQPASPAPPAVTGAPGGTSLAAVAPIPPAESPAGVPGNGSLPAPGGERPPGDGAGSTDWRPRGGAAYPEWQHLDRQLDGAHNRFADSLLGRAREAEARLTPIMREVTAEAGGTLRGEEHVLKGENALKGKLARYLTRKNATLPGALLRLNDTVRYTVQLPADEFAAGARRAIASLVGHDLRPVRQHGGWDPGCGYLGLNTTWSDPVTNHVFEVQFHTEQTFHAKMVSHALYDELRDFKVESDTDRDRRQALQAEHDAYFADVPIPEGAAEVGLPDAVRRYDPRNDLPLDAMPRLPEPDPWVAATDAEALALVRETAMATDAGLAFYAADDEIRDFAAAVPATDGYLTLDLHGSPEGFQIRNRVLSPAQFATALRELAADGRVDLSQGVKLVSCDTAAGGSDSPAARLARELGVEVLAPDQPVWTAMDGTVLVSSPRLVAGFIVPTLPPDGSWVRFDAGGVAQETYGGGTFGLVREARPDRGGGAMPRAPDEVRAAPPGGPR